jgi:hypothetical protein
MRLPRRVPIFCTLLSLTAMSTSASPSSTPNGWFSWPFVDPLPGSALDSSPLNHKPAGAHGPVVVRDGVFVTSTDGQRLRFWGCNLSSNEAFPADAAAAQRTARRLAAGGINIARLHHLDNPWSVDSAGSLWKPGSQDRIHFDPAQLDRLHQLVAALKAEGVYSNVNLKVSRTHTVEDGFPPSIAQLPAFHKRVDYFSRRHVELQKDYARQLFTARNPYTGLTLAEDPAVAAVELNNENSLLGLRTRDIAAGLHLLPNPFRAELATYWNQWLARRYPTAAALAKAWAPAPAAPNDTPISPASLWRPDAQPGNTVHLTSPGASEVHFTVQPGDGVRWRSAAYLDQLRLRENATYTLTFSARADTTRPIDVIIGRDDPLWRTDKWRSRGLRTPVALTAEWKEHRLVFVAHSIVDVPSRLTIHAGHQPGDVWLRDVRLVPGSATSGLQAAQDPAAGTVPLPTDASPAQWNDWLQFLSDTEQAYVTELRQYLRDELKVHAPIVCTQANYGGIAGLLREQTSDFIDAHCYWQHPDFAGPAGLWNTAAYTCNNTPQLAELGPRWFGELGGIALLRVTGKPFTVTELDHPAPSDYACEMYPFTAAYAGLQDWDALYTFDQAGIGAAPAADSGALQTFFDQHHHPAKWGLAPFATRLFRQGLIPPLTVRRELRVQAPFWAEANHLDVLWLKHLSGRELGFLSHRLSVDEHLLSAPTPTHVVDNGPPSSGALRLVQAPRGIVCLVEAPTAAALIGYVGETQLQAGGLGVTCAPFGLNFASIAAIALDAQPLADSQRVLLTLAARAENAGTVWNAARTSVGAVWNEGGAPVAEHVPAQLRLRTSGPRQVFALAPDGSRTAPVPTRWVDGWLEFSTTSAPASLHYECVAP